MRPDYAHKYFKDERSDFNLLMETLAMDAAAPSLKGSKMLTHLLSIILNRVFENSY